MRHRFLIGLCFIILCAQDALAKEAIYTAVPRASVVGSGVLSYAFWDIYEATLYAPEGHFNFARPAALSITYYHAIDGKAIADRSVQEMRKQGFRDEIKLAAWNTQMKAIFPDVQNGTVLSAIYIPGSQTIFYNDNRMIGTIKGDDFGRLFFGIWLAEDTSEPELRRALLGIS